MRIRCAAQAVAEDEDSERRVGRVEFDDAVTVSISSIDQEFLDSFPIVSSGCREGPKYE